MTRDIILRQLSRIGILLIFTDYVGCLPTTNSIGISNSISINPNAELDKDSIMNLASHLNIPYRISKSEAIQLIQYNRMKEIIDEIGR
ncbi:hypothetical protein GJ496_004140 [Pomphorhynchus laevis]|nr:hypothetical protein GJ496_009873 [Pomphorhynchus laevis]KAI0987189.1 hypothetical protein GJ496_004140 [Pomphorhynchus laevis]